jgi:nitrous oxidase accessory protein NosD
MRPTIRFAALAALVLVPALAGAAVVPVAPGASVQAALDVAVDGDVVELAAGVYPENIDFRGKAVTLRGAGPTSVLQGAGDAPVVTFASGEGPGSVLHDVLVTGGLADRGGAIFVQDASPTILRTVLVANRARIAGSAIYLRGSSGRFANNLVMFNGTAGGDPHSIEIEDAAPTIVNNTIVRGDSNGLILRGTSPATIMNNVFGQNGSTADGDRRGRGICDFSGGSARIHWNLFFQNRVGALLTDGTDFRRIGRADRLIGPPRLLGNRDGVPGFVRPVPRRVEDAAIAGFALRTTGRPRARDAGNPDPAFADRDGSRNDAGATGGPDAPTWLQL